MNVLELKNVLKNKNYQTMNTFQKTTAKGKPVINKITKLPEFTKSINSRIQQICRELNIPVKHTK
jgi:hypothetical protein